VSLAVGVDCVQAAPPAARQAALAAMLDATLEAPAGATGPALFALMAREHMRRYGTIRAQLTAVACKNYTHGVHNPLAAHRRKVTPQEVHDAPLVADPLGRLDCATLVDGAAAVVVTTVERARALGSPVVHIAGIGLATDALALQARRDWATLRSTTVAAERAYQMAGLGPTDIDVAEVHDVCGLAEILASEALGFFEAGHGGPAAADSRTALEGPRPLNPSGGLLARGHALAASGVAQLVALVAQLRGTAGPLQVPHARRALAQSLGGSGATSVVTILVADAEGRS
jgi:acetyl-CoA C-acetyltransferase